MKNEIRDRIIERHVNIRYKFNERTKQCFLFSVMWRLLHKIVVHRLKYHHDTGSNIYCICTICKKHFVVIDNSGYQPIDYNWIKLS
jgi:hypothetical protein